MKISASEQVVEWLSRLAPEPKRRLRVALRNLETWRGDIAPLHGELEGFYRLRIGGYRVVFRVMGVFFLGVAAFLARAVVG